MDDKTQWGETTKMNKALQLENFNLETDLLKEQLRNDSLELSQFNLETSLMEKGVI